MTHRCGAAANRDDAHRLISEIMANLLRCTLAVLLCFVGNGGAAVQTTLRQQRMSVIGRQEWLAVNTGNSQLTTDA